MIYMFCTATLYRHFNSTSTFLENVRWPLKWKWFPPSILSGPSWGTPFKWKWSDFLLPCSLLFSLSLLCPTLYLILVPHVPLFYWINLSNTIFCNVLQSSVASYFEAHLLNISYAETKIDSWIEFSLCNKSFLLFTSLLFNNINSMNMESHRHIRLPLEVLPVLWSNIVLFKWSNTL